MIHSLTHIHPNAKIGENVTVEAFTTIQGDVEIGEGTWIGPNVTIMDGARIGRHCRIFPGAVISGIPQDLKFDGEVTQTIIGDRTTIRECVTISRGTKDKFKTVIGSDCLLMAYVHVAHDCLIGNHCILANAVQMAGHVQVDDHVVIGGTTAIHQFVRIGAHVMVSGGSLVRKDIPPYAKAGREPLSYCGINSLGLSRRGFSREQIDQIKDIYRYIYLRGLNNRKAVELIKAELPQTPERDYVVDFVQKAARGIMKGYSSQENGEDD